MSKDLTIIIPVYNTAPLIDRCLDSLFSQTDKYSIEVIVIDDGSTDNSVELIKRRKEDIILLQQENSGPAAARNKGIAAANGQYIAFLDADDYWLPGFINQTIDFLNKYPECIAVSVAQKHITLSGEHKLPQYIVENEHNETPFVIDDFFRFWAQYNHVCTGSITIRADIAKATGGQRKELRICEDLEFWAYLATYGQFGFIPQILFVSDGGKVTEKIGWVEKNIKRWNSAPTVDEWEKRVCNRLVRPLPYSYLKSRGKIARNLCYSILLSKRYDLAYKQIKCYKADFPTGTMTHILRIGVINKVFWKIISFILTYREYHRK